LQSQPLTGRISGGNSRPVSSALSLAQDGKDPPQLSNKDMLKQTTRFIYRKKLLNGRLDTARTVIVDENV
jgi:hypothetical protein